MCELFALSSRRPARLTFSFDEFARRGGLTAPHAHGWGVASYQDGDVQLLREPHPAATSPCVRYLHDRPLVSSLVLSHVRLATRGGVALRNTQPFSRELAGRVHVFAHNGHVAGAMRDSAFSLGRFRPVGDTDSEHVFCALLARLEQLWIPGGEPPSLGVRRELVALFARELAPHGPANFLYSDGEALFAHGHRRTQTSGTIEPPGLHMLCKSCIEDAAELDGVALESENGEQRITLVASRPLGGGTWRALGEGEILVLRHGEAV